MKKLAPVIIALAVAVFIGIMVLRILGGGSEPTVEQAPVEVVQAPVNSTPTIQQVDVFVASRDLPIGTTLGADDIDIQPWPQHLLIDGFITTDRQDINLVQMVTRAEFREREPLILSKLVNPDDPNFLAGSLPPGRRAVTIATDGVSSVAGFVFPGDRVDVLVTHEVIKEGVTEKDTANNRQGNMEESVSETLLTNIKVLAVDQRSTANAEEGILIPSLITLEVTPEDAQRMRLAQDIGALSLSLRSIKDKDTVESISLTRPADLSQADASLGMGSGFVPVTVVRGTDVDNEEARKERLGAKFESLVRGEY